jgi:chemotaxis protein CheD
MAENIRVIHIGQAVASKEPGDVLVTYGLGSCVVVCLYDPVTKVGAMLHALLPTQPTNGRTPPNPAKYVDTGVPQLIAAAQKLGARRIWLTAKICGGARMLTVDWLDSEPAVSDHLNIGGRNVVAAQKALKAAGVRLVAQSTGGSAGRTVKLRISDGEVIIKTLERGEEVLDVTPEEKQRMRGY